MTIREVIERLKEYSRLYGDNLPCDISFDDQEIDKDDRVNKSLENVLADDYSCTFYNY